MMPTYPTSDCKHQKGGALLVMLVILVMGITTVFITSLSGNALQNHRNQSSAEALAIAKEALIGYALTYGDTHAGAHGYLPCPDMDGTAGGSSPYEGTSETCGSAGAHSMGRLPWRTLDLPALYDGAGECLWYSVSGKYKNNPPSATTMNWDNPGEFTIYAGNGDIVEAGEVVAAVIAPGAPLSGNSSRAADNTAPTCGGNYNADAYLENDSVHTPAAINNSDITAGKLIMPHEHRDGDGNVTSSTNDQIIYITRQDIWNGIQKRIARQAKKCLDDYAAATSNTNHKYPWAVPLSDATVSPNRTGTMDVRFGRFPDIPNTSTPGGGTCPTSGSNLTTLNASEITTLNQYIDLVSAALTDYTNNPSSTTRNNLQDAGDNLWDLARNSPYNLPIGDPIRSQLGYYLENNCTGSSCYILIPTIQTRLADAISEFNSCTGSGGTDSSMPSNWDFASISSTACADLISSTSWPAWRDWVFYQIADGYQPGGAGSCTSGTTCLSVSSDGSPLTGSGDFHAVIAIAGKALNTQNSRVASPSDTAQFLDKDPSPGAPLGDNQTGKINTPTSTGFTTYRNTNAGHATVNDLVLCVDGKNNCP
jgi:type II secretory pathway pseudopilin PulG